MGILEAIESGWRKLRCSPRERPIIVVGNQKSGTSAIAHLLADFGGLSKTVDIRALWPPTGNAIMDGRESFHRVVSRNPCAFASELFKEPMMTFFLDQVITRFPEARVVFVVRDPRDNIRSLFNRRDLPGDLAELPEEVFEEVHQGRIVVDSDVWGGQDTNYVGVAALRWNRAFRAYNRWSHRLALIRFEDFLEDKYATIRQLANRLGVRQKMDIADRLDVQYQPRGNREVDWETFFGETNLRRIEGICLDGLERFDYPRTML